MQVNLLNNNSYNNQSYKSNAKAPSFKHIYQVDCFLNGKHVSDEKTIRNIFNTLARKIIGIKDAKSCPQTPEDKDLLSKIHVFYSYFDKKFNELHTEGIQNAWQYLRLAIVQGQPYGFSLAHARDINKRGCRIKEAGTELRDLKRHLGIYPGVDEEKIAQAEELVKQRKAEYFSGINNDVRNWEKYIPNKQKLLLYAQRIGKTKQYRITGMRNGLYENLFEPTFDKSLIKVDAAAPPKSPSLQTDLFGKTEVA